MESSKVACVSRYLWVLWVLVVRVLSGGLMRSLMISQSIVFKEHNDYRYIVDYIVLLFPVFQRQTFKLPNRLVCVVPQEARDRHRHRLLVAHELPYAVRSDYHEFVA